MKAIIMAGGRGERLKPITDTIPKPMVEVAEKPILLHVVNLFKKYGINDFVFTLCHLSNKITSYFGNGSKFGINIDYLVENSEMPMGTAGGIALSKKYINSTFIVTSGDILRKINIKKMIEYHKQKNSFATLNTYKRFGSNPKSMILFDNNRQIKKFVERPNSDNIKKDFVWSNGSFYIFEPEIFDFIPKNLESDFGKNIFPELLKHGKKIYAFPTEDYFIDIGNPEKLKTARNTYKSTT